MSVLFDISSMTKTYGQGKLSFNALENLSIQINEGEFVAIVGPSGSGKTTLLNIMSGLDYATSGEVRVMGQNIEKLSTRNLCEFRRDYLGFVFQSYNLIPVLTVKENIEYVMLLQGVSEKIRTQKVDAILEEVGLTGMQNRFPRELSGGQQQRVAVARAIVHTPRVVLADEPTANLDSHTGTQLIDLMYRLNEKLGITFIFSTHDTKIMERAKRLVTMEDGKIINDQAN